MLGFCCLCQSVVLSLIAETLHTNSPYSPPARIRSSSGILSISARRPAASPEWALARLPPGPVRSQGKTWSMNLTTSLGTTRGIGHLWDEFYQTGVRVG